ncbi:unnamed protein product [Phytophthora fragariaefolia]|uniref:Unnamed protein product n=1 Tax=Phytophthora fragariaefolia TaxID=1490495 RepID=A0A9W6X025_9STRA|nr:unnamed protein product [Phytophthora fragariaefolia]
MTDSFAGFLPETSLSLPESSRAGSGLATSSNSPARFRVMGRGAPPRPADTLPSSEASKSSPKSYPSASEPSYPFTSSSLASEIPPADSSKLTDLSEIDERRPPLPAWGVGPPSVSIRPDFIGVAGTAEDPLVILVFLLVSFLFLSFFFSKAR